MATFLAKVGFPVESKFSANGLTKLEFETIKIEAIGGYSAECRLYEAYGNEIVIVSVKEV